jgi:hypothetical protein
MVDVISAVTAGAIDCEAARIGARPDAEATSDTHAATTITPFFTGNQVMIASPPPF